jgi:hypothetical protein
VERAVDGESESFREKRSRASLLLDGGQFAALKTRKQTVKRSMKSLNLPKPIATYFAADKK